MSTKSRNRQGIERGGELLRPFSDEITIIGLDIEAAALKALYVGTKREKWTHEVIDGLVQLQRTKDGAPRWMVDGMADGVNPPPVALVDLNLDNQGRNWTALVDGRQRTMARRVEDAEHIKNGGAPKDRRQLIAVGVVFPATRTYEAVVMYTVTSNLRVVRSVSSRAEDAHKLRNDGNGKSLEALIPLCEVTTTEEVEQLLALHECEDSAKDAVNAGKVLLSAAILLSKKTAAEQDAWVARHLAGPGKKAKDAAAPPRPKAMPAKKVLAFRAELERLSDVPKPVLALLRYLSAQNIEDSEAILDFPYLKKAAESASGVAGE